MKKHCRLAKDNCAYVQHGGLDVGTALFPMKKHCCLAKVNCAYVQHGGLGVGTALFPNEKALPSRERQQCLMSSMADCHRALPG